jgi:acyl-CoA thioester hydrolase
MEEQGIYMVVVRLNCNFRLPARYDDLLTLRTSISRVGAAKLEHEYRLYRDGVLLTEAQSTLACVDSEGKIQPIPEQFRAEPAG